MKNIRPLVFGFTLLFSLRAYGLGPVDGEVGVLGWGVGDYETGDFNTPMVSGYGELWLNERWGFRGALYRVNEDSVLMAPDEQTFFDFKYRLLSATDSTFLALGLGWEQNRFGADGSGSGPRIMAEGRVGMGFLKLYTEIGWAPALGDVGARQDISSIAAEAGLVLDPFPFFDVRLGWRYQISDYTGVLTGSDVSEASYGVIMGAGFHW